MQTTADNAEFRFSDQDFRAIADLANARFGLALQSSKKALVYARLSKRLRALNLPDFESYCQLLKAGEGADEQPHFLTALTTNVTHFFREMHHFTTLRDVVAPILLDKAKKGQPVRLWSAACSAGQEAYCIAASILAGAPDLQKLDVKILATDIDPQVLETARQARYPDEQRAAIPPEWERLMIGKSDAATQSFEISPTLRSMVQFNALNLIGEWPMRRSFDVIICRNAAIYFDKDTQATLWQRFAKLLTSEGYLMIGHSERVTGAATASFQSVGITTYQKTPAGAAALMQGTGETA